MIKKIVVLGASGSVGQQALAVLKERKDYEVIGISVWNNIEELQKILESFSTIKFVCVHHLNEVKKLGSKYATINFYEESDGLLKLINDSKADVYLNAILGFAGTYPSIEVLSLNKVLLLANKETLVVAGKFVNQILSSGKGKLYPIDSEHVAIAKCLYNKRLSDVKELVLTASGGAFCDYTRDQLEKVTIDEAIRNPNWKMGQKITVDSNTMINKAFELIEAYYLFKMPIDDIKAVINRESIVHSYVVFKDEIRLNVGIPSMKYPIIYALDFGKCNEDKFSDVEINTLNLYKFKSISSERFPILDYSKFIINKEGDAGCVFNACDEEVVEAFLEGKITFKQIDELVIMELKNHKYRKNIELKDLGKINDEVKEETRKLIKENMRRD